MYVPDERTGNGGQERKPRSQEKRRERTRVEGDDTGLRHENERLQRRLTQMVGRALRGPRFGGTPEAYIVSFIDDWKQRIRWATYDQLQEGPADDAVRGYPETAAAPPSPDHSRRVLTDHRQGVIGSRIGRHKRLDYAVDR